MRLYRFYPAFSIPPAVRGRTYRVSSKWNPIRSLGPVATVRCSVLLRGKNNPGSLLDHLISETGRGAVWCDTLGKACNIYHVCLCLPGDGVNRYSIKVALIIAQLF